MTRCPTPATSGEKPCLQHGVREWHDESHDGPVALVPAPTPATSLQPRMTRQVLAPLAAFVLVLAWWPYGALVAAVLAAACVAAFVVRRGRCERGAAAGGGRVMRTAGESRAPRGPYGMSSRVDNDRHVAVTSSPLGGGEVTEVRYVSEFERAFDTPSETGTSRLDPVKAPAVALAAKRDWLDNAGCRPGGSHIPMCEIPSTAACGVRRPHMDVSRPSLIRRSRRLIPRDRPHDPRRRLRRMARRLRLRRRDRRRHVPHRRAAPPLGQPAHRAPRRRPGRRVRGRRC